MEFGLDQTEGPQFSTVSGQQAYCFALFTVLHKMLKLLRVMSYEMFHNMCSFSSAVRSP